MIQHGMRNGVSKACRNLTFPFLLKTVPAFLCPILLETGGRSHKSSAHYRGLTTSSPALPPPSDSQPNVSKLPPQGAPPSLTRKIPLPATCSGCGALRQTACPGEAGFYSTTRKSVKAFIAYRNISKSLRRSPEDQIFKSAVERVDDKLLRDLGLDVIADASDYAKDETLNPPVCDRCHSLLHHHHGVLISHPSLPSIKGTIFESTYKNNHIYHVIDAADFPLSLIPDLQRRLALNPQRSHNRRAKTGKFLHGRRAEMSFIITRADLLAPKKEQVDSLMPYLVQVLRDALGTGGRDMRLGNVRCVSSQRGWWTKEIKEEIWSRGGASWMVGKVNVGKSKLVETVFPKGRNENAELGRQRKHTNTGHYIGSLELHGAEEPGPAESNEPEGPTQPVRMTDGSVEEASLLPPSQVEMSFPPMPIVSSLPGTTACPIRLPFGNGKGQLIDLPGLSRGDLETYIQQVHRKDLVMRARVNAKQHVIKPGQSLLLGGFIRITPSNPEIVILAYPFVPIEAHVTSTDKAKGIQTQQRGSGVDTILEAGLGDKIASAGLFPLRWDITKQRSGPLTSPAALGLSPEHLPYTVLSTDILIEGCGWIELVAQVRKSQQPCSTSSPVTGKITTESGDGTGVSYEQRDDQEVQVEVFSPEGKYIGSRRPLNAWHFSGEKKTAVSKGKRRPRPSMKGSKKSARPATRIT